MVDLGGGICAYCLESFSDQCYTISFTDHALCTRSIQTEFPLHWVAKHHQVGVVHISTHSCDQYCNATTVNTNLMLGKSSATKNTQECRRQHYHVQFLAMKPHCPQQCPHQFQAVFLLNKHKILQVLHDNVVFEQRHRPAYNGLVLGDLICMYSCQRQSHSHSREKLQFHGH